jgi:excisionase family DNA binding protein
VIKTVINWSELPPVLNVSEAAQIARVGKQQIYNLVHSNTIQAVKFGKIIRIPRDRFKSWLENISNKEASTNE